MSRQDNLIVGLGNPGSEYTNNRHNIGFQVVDVLLGLLDRSATYKEKWDGLYSSIVYSQEKVHFIKPQTFMNRSGQPVSQFYILSMGMTQCNYIIFKILHFSK